MNEPPPPDNWGDELPPESFPSDWRAQEVVPGGFVLEGQNLPPVQTVRAESEDVAGPGEIQTDVEGTSPELPDAQNTSNNETSTPVEEPEKASESTQMPVSTSPAPAVPKAGSAPAMQAVGSASATSMENPLAPARPDPPYIVLPAAVYAGEDLHMITVVLRPGADKVRDNLRLRQAYGILISYPGHDRFALQIFERGRGYRVEFPNFTTGLCPELLTRLQALVGAGNILVEPLTIQ